MKRAVFSGMDQPSSRIRLLDLNNLPNVTAIGQAYQRMVDLLTGAVMQHYSFSPKGIHTLSLLYGDGHSGYILWTDDDRTVSLPLSPELVLSQKQTADGKQVPTAETVTITPMPLYLKIYNGHLTSRDYSP